MANKSFSVRTRPSVPLKKIHGGTDGRGNKFPPSSIQCNDSGTNRVRTGTHGYGQEISSEVGHES